MPGTRAPYFGHEALLDQVNMLLKEFEEQPWISVKGKFKATVLTQCKIEEFQSFMTVQCALTECGSY